MYSIPQTLLSGQTLLSKRCYDPQFLVVTSCTATMPEMVLRF
jgi:hypothetical protein